MHMQGTPATMQLDPRYGDVVAEIAGFFAERLRAAASAGIDVEQRRLPGYLEMLARPHNTRVPDQALAAIVGTPQGALVIAATRPRG